MQHIDTIFNEAHFGQVKSLVEEVIVDINQDNPFFREIVFDSSESYWKFCSTLLAKGYSRLNSHIPNMNEMRSIDFHSSGPGDNKVWICSERLSGNDDLMRLAVELLL